LIENRLGVGWVGDYAAGAGGADLFGDEEGGLIREVLAYAWEVGYYGDVE
jgi:hypothetical protein